MRFKKHGVFLKSVLALSFLFFADAAKAQDEASLKCECERYRSLYDLDQKSEQMNRIAEAAGGLKVQLRKSNIPLACRGYFYGSSADVEIESRVSLQPSAHTVFEDTNTYKILIDYWNFRSKFTSCSTVGCLAQRDWEKEAQQRQRFFMKEGKESDTDANFLKNNPGFGITNESQFRVMGAYDAMVTQIRSGTSLDAWGKQFKDRLSVEEKVQLMLMVGAAGNSIYDKQRAAASKSLTGSVVSMDDLLKGLGVLYQDPENKSQVGVCRDWATLQSRVGSALGLKTYMVASQVSDQLHVDVIAADPSRPAQVFRVNWGGVSKTEGFDGASLLFQSAADVGINYRIYDSNGKPLVTMPTHLGKVLDEVVGAGLRTQDPMATAQASVVKASLRVGRGSQVSIFMATDPTSARTIGSAFQTKWGEGTHFPGQNGTAVYFQDRAAVSGMGEGGAVPGMVGAYNRVEQHAVLGGEVTSGLTLKADASVAIGVNATYASAGEKEGNVMGDAYATGNLEGTLGYQGEGAALQAQVGVSVQPINSNAQTVGDFTGIVNHTYARISGQVEAGANSHLSATVAADRNGLGDRGLAQVGWTTGSFTLRGGWSGALNSTDIPLQENSLSRVNLGMQYDLGSAVISANGSIPINVDAPPAFNLGFSGSY